MVGLAHTALTLLLVPLKQLRCTKMMGAPWEFDHPHESYVPVGELVQATLVKEGSAYIYTLPNQTKLEFNSEGRLTKETDRNGNSITLAYNSEKQLESATDGAGRKLPSNTMVAERLKAPKTR